MYIVYNILYTYVYKCAVSGPQRFWWFAQLKMLGTPVVMYAEHHPSLLFDKN